MTINKAANNLIVICETGLPPLETFCLLKALPDLEEAYFGAESGVDLRIYKNFVKRCSFAKFLEFLFLISQPNDKLVSLHIKTLKEESVEDLIKEIDFTSTLYYEKSRRSFR